MTALPEPPQNHPEKTNGSHGGKLSSQTVTTITIISIVGFISILLMLFGNFEGKIERVVSTLVLFGIFTFFSSYRMGRSKSPLHTPILQIGNNYMLLLSLVLIWGTLFVDDDYYDWELLTKTLFIALIIQLGVFVTQKISVFVHSEQKQMSTAATLTLTGLSAATFLFSLPLGLDDFTSFGEGYWKFSIAVILFTGLMLSITSLIVWAFGRNDAGLVPVGKVPAQTYQASALPNWKDEGRIENERTSAPQDAETSQSAPAAPQGGPQFAPPVDAALPWPVFPNGQPLPPRSNGRPDFTALQTLAAYYAESERKFFG